MSKASPSSFVLFLFFLNLLVFIYVYVCIGQKESVSMPEAGVAGTGDLPGVGGRKHAQALCKKGSQKCQNRD